MPTDQQPASLKQGSDEWRRARLGKITASRFSDVLVQPRSKAAREAGELSGSARSYMLDILAEILTGESQDDFTSKATQWGNDWEPVACDVYAELTGLEVQEVGFVQHPDEPMIGGSPDRLIGDDGLLEVKCPYNTRVHLGYLIDGVLPKEHTAQVQGGLWFAKRKWAHFLSYTPHVGNLALATFLVRVERDEAYIRNLAEAVFRFRDTLLETLCRIKSRGGKV